MLEQVTANRNSDKIVEEEFSQEITALLRTHLGLETIEAQAHFVDDLILIRVRGVLTPAEISLAERSDGQELVEGTLYQLFETTRPFVGKLVRESVGRDLLNLRFYLDTVTGEQLILVWVDTALSPDHANLQR